MSEHEITHGLLQARHAVVVEMMEILNEESDKDVVPKPRIRRTIHRDREGAHEGLVSHYFSENPTYTDEQFRMRFRMTRRLFQRIVSDLEGAYVSFQWRTDGRGKKGLSPLQKCTFVIRKLAYGIALDMMDEYVQLGERTSRDCLNNFCIGIIQLYHGRYLHRPTYDDISRLYTAHENTHDFVGMLGSIDCTHWEWANCPVAWQGQYTRGDHGRPTVILQVVASHALWLWQAFFGVSGSNNDINVLNQSPILSDAVEGRTPSLPSSVNNVFYHYGYYLADGIYPYWAIFVKSPACPIDEKRKKFKRDQESARKDVRRAFGVLKSRWHILHHPTLAAHSHRLQNIMYACVILNNMILEDEGQAISILPPDVVLPNNEGDDITEEQRAQNSAIIRNEHINENLRSDLCDHI